MSIVVAVAYPLDGPRFARTLLAALIPSAAIVVVITDKRIRDIFLCLDLHLPRSRDDGVEGVIVRVLKRGLENLDDTLAVPPHFAGDCPSSFGQLDFDWVRTTHSLFPFREIASTGSG